MEYLRKMHMICFEPKELIEMFMQQELKKLTLEMGKRGFVPLQSDKDQVEEVIDFIIKRNKNIKEDIEVFVALDFYLTFFPENGKICFVLKDSYNPKTHFIKNLKRLKCAVKEDSLTDFAIFSNGLRQIQLKQYKGEMCTHIFFEFLKKVLAKYGNNLGSVNLLILLQGNGPDFSQCNIDFEEIYKKIKEFNLKFNSEIMIIRNEANQYSILTQVYPELKQMKKPFELASKKWQNKQ